MATVSTNIRIDEDVKKNATELFKACGMNLSEAINIFLNQSLLEGGIPFKIGFQKDKPNWATRRAMKEGDKIAKHPEKYKDRLFKTPEDFFAEMEKW